MLAPQLEQLLSAARAQDAAVTAQRAMLDKKLDLFNDLTDWAANTKHGEAAVEVTQILEKYAQKQPASAA